MSPIELTATVLGVACVVLVVRRSLWNYPFAIASVALFGVVFLRAKLYSDALLQVFYVVINVYGWWNWSRTGTSAGAVMVELMTIGQCAAWLVGSALATLIWGAAMHRYTDASYPWIDGGVAIVSVAAQILLARRKLENWVLWIAVDIVAVPLYAAKGLWAAAGLYVIYLLLSAWGLLDWHRVRRAAGPAVA